MIFLDLEDAVAPDDKPTGAQEHHRGAQRDDWGTKTLSVRINGLDTHFMYRDVVDVLEQTGERLDLIMIPKVGTAADVYALDMLVTQIETMKRPPEAHRLRAHHRDRARHAECRGDRGRAPAQRIVAFRRCRLCRLDPGPHHQYRRCQSGLFGSHRRRAAGARATGATCGIMPWPGWCVAARANGLRPIDGPFGDFGDAEGFKAAARRAAALGCEGKWAIHPSQIALANDVMSPSEKEVTRARRILAAMEEAAKAGKGAVSLDGRLIDYASIRQAEVLVSKAEQIEAAARK